MKLIGILLLLVPSWLGVQETLAQYKAPSELFDQIYKAQEASLAEFLKRHPDLFHIYYPMQYSIPKDYYM